MTLIYKIYKLLYQEENMKKFLTRILIVAMYLLLIVGLFDINKIRAASYGFNFVGPTSANNGDTITLTITANGLTGKVSQSK